MEIIEAMPQDVMDLKESLPRVEREQIVIAAQIKDAATIDVAYAWCADRKREVDAVIERLSRGKKQAWAAYQEWQILEKETTEPRLKAIKAVKERIGVVTLELERQADAEQQRVLADARREAELKAQKDAKKLEAKGEPEMARAAIQAAAAFIPPVLQVEKPKLGRVRPVWRVRLKGNTDQERRANLLKFVKQICESRPELITLIQLNEKEMGKEAERYESECPYQGIEFYPEAHVSLAPQRRMA